MNSRNREAWFVPATYTLKVSSSEDAELLTNLTKDYADKRNWNLRTETPVRDALLLLAPEITHFTVPTPETKVNLHFGREFPALIRFQAGITCPHF